MIIVIRWNYLFLPWCTVVRGWKIQWSIVPEVSEPVVSYLLSLNFWYQVLRMVCRSLASICFSVYSSGASKRGSDCVGEVPAGSGRRSESSGETLRSGRSLMDSRGHLRKDFTAAVSLFRSLQNLFGKMANILEKIKKWVFLHVDFFFRAV